MPDSITSAGVEHSFSHDSNVDVLAHYIAVGDAEREGLYFRGNVNTIGCSQRRFRDIPIYSSYNDYSNSLGGSLLKI